MIIQIYEIQTPLEAKAMIRMGVNHIGSVIVSKKNWKIESIRETIAETRRLEAKSSLIPLFSEKDLIFRVLDYYQPDIIHMCENITSSNLDDLIDLQQNIKDHYPDIQVMRSIPIQRKGQGDCDRILNMAKRFECCSDYFLTDTKLSIQGNDGDSKQPVEGFVGITGLTCDWDAATELVSHSGIPVILAGGISPQNVFDGIKTVQPAGIDSCTQTNAVDQNGKPIRFKKNLRLVEKLVQEAKRGEQYLLSI